MAKEIVWSRNAIIDRIHILDYWFKQTGAKTYSYYLDILFKESVSQLKNYPEIGRKLDNREERFLVKDHFQIFYRVSIDRIEILHIWDSRRNPENLEL